MQQPSPHLLQHPSRWGMVRVGFGWGGVASVGVAWGGWGGGKVGWRWGGCEVGVGWGEIKHLGPHDCWQPSELCTWGLGHVPHTRHAFELEKEGMVWRATTSLGALTLLHHGEKVDTVCRIEDVVHVFLLDATPCDTLH